MSEQALPSPLRSAPRDRDPLRGQTGRSAPTGKLVGVDNLMTALLEARTAVLADVDLASGPTERLLVRSNLTGTMQLYELDGGSELRQVTRLPEPVYGGHHVPGERRAVIAVDAGGNDAIDLPSRPPRATAQPPSLPWGPETTDGGTKYGHRFAGLSADGRLLAYLADKANGVDFDLWLCDLQRGDHSLVFASGVGANRHRVFRRTGASSRWSGLGRGPSTTTCSWSNWLPVR